MLPRRSRLSREGFDSLSNARRHSSAHFSLSVQENGLFTGCGVVVPKKIAKLAVSRHRLRRRIFNVIAPFCTESMAFAVYAKTGSKDLAFEELEKELLGLLEEAGIR